MPIHSAPTVNASMRFLGRRALACAIGLTCLSTSTARGQRPDVPVLETGGQHPMPDEWIDRDTGHRVRKLVRREGTNSSFYFTNPAFVPRRTTSGGLMLFHGSTARGSQLFVIDLATNAIRQLTDLAGGVRGEIVAPDNGSAFYQSHDSVLAVDVRSGASKLLVVLPMRGSISTINADATVLAGVTAGPEAAEILRKYPAKADYFTRIFEAHVPHSLWTLDVRTGALKTIHSENTWLGHVQFSPTEPDLLMFCHEGPWNLLDRIWTISLRTHEVKKIHTRSMEGEIAGHEFWSPDGRTIWYDLQTPRSVTFFLRGVDVASGAAKTYSLDRDDWGIHFNVSPDQAIYASDGGDSSQVARTKQGRWINLLRPVGDHLVSERLVNMFYQNYRREEPNVQFTPDGKGIVFRGNFDGGETQVYAVEVAKSR